MSEPLKLALVAGLAGLSALVSAQTILMVSNRLPDLRAAKAESTLPTPAATADTAPAPPAEAIPRGRDGHYWADGQVGAASVRFLVDTGATAVALTPDDAKRLGFDLSALTYSNRVITAAGQTRAASVKLASLTVSGTRLENVDALVIEKGLDTSLLGMTYLGRLAGFRATPQALVLER